MRHITLLAALALSAAAARGAEPERAVPERPRNVWFGLPVAFYLPETSYAFGVTGGLHLLRPGRRPSSLQPTAYVTVNRQYSAELLVELHDTPRTVLSGSVRAARFPSRSYGLGPDAPAEAEEEYATRFAELIAERGWTVARGLRTGPRLHLRAEEVTDAEPGGFVASGRASADRRSAGGGAGAVLDTRDDRFWPGRGTLVEGWVLGYGSSSGRGFARAALHGRRFLALGRGHVLGLDARGEGAWGDVPFTLLPAVGGSSGLRGYLEGRWRDRALWGAQAEWRFPLGWRLRGAAFGGASGVAPSLARLAETRARPAGGLGLRFRLTSTGLNVRGDVAAGEDGIFTYLTIGEAF